MKRKYSVLSLFTIYCLLFWNMVSAQGFGTTSTTTSNIQPPTGYCGVGVAPVPNENQYEVNWNSSLSNVDAKPEDYSWTGTDGFSGNKNQLSYRYSTTGIKIGTVTIHSSQGVHSFNCSVNFPSIPPANSQYRLGATCQPNVNGMFVLWSTNVSGTPSPDTVSTEWFGTDGLATTTRQVNYTYSTPGLKTANLTVRSGNEVLYMTCQALVASTSNCFIATAAYGTSEEPEVMVLRHFRDETLLKNKAGQLFVATYYKVSPGIADYIRDKEDLKTIVRAGLAPAIFVLKEAGYK